MKILPLVPKLISKVVRIVPAVEKRVPDETVLALLEKYAGDRKLVAKELGLSIFTVRERILRAEASSPLAHFKKHTKPSRLADEDLAATLEEYGGNRVAAARALHISTGLIALRIRRADPGTPLAAFKDVTTKFIKARAFDDEVLAEVLAGTGGNRKEAAEVLGVHSNKVSARVHAPSASAALAPFRDVKAKGAYRFTLDDAGLAEVLKDHEGNFTRAAAKLGVSEQIVYMRVRQAAEDSPLAAFKSRESRAPGGTRLSASKVAHALKKHDGDRTRAAAELGVGTACVQSYIRGAEEGSPLINFRGYRPRFSKADFAAAVAEVGKNIKAIMEKLGASRTTVVRRLGELGSRILTENDC